MKPVVCFGDSLTEGYMVAPQESYPWRLARLVGRDVINMGVSGHTTGDGVRRLPHVLALNPGLVLVEFGINDYFLSIDENTARSNLSTIATRLLDLGSRVVLIGFSLPDGGASTWGQMYQNLGRELGVPVIEDIFHGLHGRPECFLPDGLHPSAEGYRIIAEKCYNFLLKNSLI